MTTIPEIKTLKALTTLPIDKMTMYSDQAEAVRAAIQRGQAFIYHFPPNHTYYVAVSK